MKKIIFSLLCLILLLPKTVNAEDRRSTGYLYNQCLEVKKDINQKQNINNLDIGLCLGYLSGLSDGLKIMMAAIKKPPICFPKNITNQQSVVLFLNYVDKHPETMHQIMFSTIISAYKEAFPCQTKN